MAEYTYGKDFAIRTETDCIATENDFGQYVGRITAVKIKTNGDRIRAMTDEELAEFIMDVQGDVANYYCGNYSSEPSLPTRKEAWLEWLREEADEEEM